MIYNTFVIPWWQLCNTSSSLHYLLSNRSVMDLGDDMVVQIEFEAYNDYLEQQEPSLRSKQEDVNYIMEILKHSCQWKGGRDPPTSKTLRSICDLKKISCPIGENKFIIFRRLISTLREELFTMDPDYVCPKPTTAAAKLLFEGELDTKIRVFVHQETGMK